MASLGIDRVLGTLEQLAPRRARGRTASSSCLDHGRSQGATFKQRYGIATRGSRPPTDRRAQPPCATGATDEQRGRVSTLLRRTRPRQRLVGRAQPTAAAGRPKGTACTIAASRTRRLVVASRQPRHGLLRQPPGRQTVEEHPGPPPGRRARSRRASGIGFIMVRSRTDGPVVFGNDGVHYLDDGRVEGEDPLARFGSHAVAPTSAAWRRPAACGRHGRHRISPDWTIPRERRGGGVRGTGRLPRRSGLAGRPGPCWCTQPTWPVEEHAGRCGRGAPPARSGGWNARATGAMMSCHPGKRSGSRVSLGWPMMCQLLRLLGGALGEQTGEEHDQDGDPHAAQRPEHPVSNT